MARKDPSPVVRLYLAAGMQRLPLEQRWDVVTALVAHEEDATDHNLPLMDWYALEPLAEVDAARALSIAHNSHLPRLLSFMVRRITSSVTPKALDLVVKALIDEAKLSDRAKILGGLDEGLRGHPQVKMPDRWPTAYGSLSADKDAGIRNLALSVAVTFGDAKALAELRRVVSSAHEDVPARKSALATLLGAKDPELLPILQNLLKLAELRNTAIRAFASYDHPETPAVLLALYPSLSADDKRDTLNTLASRVSYALALMNAIGEKKVPATDVPAEVVRQLRNFSNKDLEKRIGQVWGLVRTTPAERTKLIAEWKQKIIYYPADPDPSFGRAVFAKTCQQCHTLYGIGGKVGPDITGSNRANLDYLLENVLDPSAVIPNDYRATLIELKDGRVVTGIIRGETATALTVVTANETLTIPTSDVEKRTISNTSMMPDDLLTSKPEVEVQALIAYLRLPHQVPLLATSENAKDLFNGKDLSGWDGDPKLWSVENGEIVGKSPGIKKNEFLKSHLATDDFRLTLKVKLVPNRGNSGVQFHTEVLPDGDVKGPQADIGAGWWGKLYEENARGVLSNNDGEKYVKVDDWNDYEIVAEGTHVRTYINGKPCVDLDDPKLSRRGIFAFQIHAGGPMEVRFKDIKLEVLAPPKHPAAK
jgi:putative heme-binding domain-containing protein